MNDIPPDSLALTGEQKNDVRRMAALGYAPEDIAAYLGLDASECFLFVYDAGIPGTTIRGLIREGVLVSRAAPEIKLHETAEDGNIDAVKLLTEIQERRLFKHSSRYANSHFFADSKWANSPRSQGWEKRSIFRSSPLIPSSSVPFRNISFFFCFPVPSRRPIS